MKYLPGEFVILDDRPSLFLFSDEKEVDWFLAYDVLSKTIMISKYVFVSDDNYQYYLRVG